MPRQAYVNGRFLPHRNATVHIEDRGYQFADGVYEVVPLIDGILIDGNSSVDESMLSGEPVPVQKAVGDEVAAGTINKMGSFLFQAKRIGKETVLSQIIEMVRTAQSSKPAIGC